MVTSTDLEDFALDFSLFEVILVSVGELLDCDVVSEDKEFER